MRELSIAAIAIAAMILMVIIALESISVDKEALQVALDASTARYEQITTSNGRVCYILVDTNGKEAK